MITYWSTTANNNHQLQWVGYDPTRMDGAWEVRGNEHPRSNWSRGDDVRNRNARRGLLPRSIHRRILPLHNILRGSYFKFLRVGHVVGLDVLGFVEPVVTVVVSAVELKALGERLAVVVYGLGEAGQLRGILVVVDGEIRIGINKKALPPLVADASVDITLAVEVESVPKPTASALATQVVACGGKQSPEMVECGWHNCEIFRKKASRRL